MSGTQKEDPPPMMGCGHTANAVVEDTKQPVCAICYGIKPEAVVVVAAPDLTGRTMRCSCIMSCKVKRPSDPAAAFFEHRPTAAFDSFYCGCDGWD